MTTATPSEALNAIERRRHEQDTKLHALDGERREHAERLHRTRAHALNVQAQVEANGDTAAAPGLKAALKTAITERDKARTAYEESERRDWAGERQVLEQAIRLIDAERERHLASQAAPLVDEMVPRATENAEEIMEALESLQRLFVEHGQIRSRAEQVIRHLDFYDQRRDIPADTDQFQPLLREINQLTGSGIGWPLPDLRKPPFKLLFHSDEDQAAWQPPAEQAA